MGRSRETGPGPQPPATVSNVPSRRRLVTRAALCALLVLASCASPPERTSVPAPADADLETALAPGGGTTSAAAPAPATEAARPSVDPAGGSGLIAASGPTGLRFLRSDGSEVFTVAADQVVTQPTWSRDGSRLAATLLDPNRGEAWVIVVDVTTWDVTTAKASRPYFFYTWSYDGSRLAALGPSPTGGTAADILDGTGAPASGLSLISQSLFVAWEPGGDRLLLHAGHGLLLVDDVDSPDSHHDFGPVGFDFQAPAWVPGTGDFLYVDSYAQAPIGTEPEALVDRSATTTPQLLRRSADSGEITELGPAGAFTLMAVHPTGDRAAISVAELEPAAAGGSLEAAVLEAGQPAQAEPSVGAGSVQIVDLATAERRTVIDRIGLWLEWSPDGERLLIGTSASDDRESVGLAWYIWDGNELSELARFAPTATFFRDYVQFADQYTEAPRLWSPDSTAIAFGAQTADYAVSAVAQVEGSGGVTALGLADVSFWSPVDVDPPPVQPG